jgi:hypothetical protein
MTMTKPNENPTKRRPKTKTPPLHWRDRLYVKPRLTQQILGVGKTKVFELLKSGALESVEVDGMRLIAVASILRLGRTG